MSARLRRLGREGARFASVNVVATVVAMVLFNLLTHGIRGWYGGPLNDRPLTSYVLSNTVGMLISFLGARYYVFRERQAVGPGGGFLHYAIVNLSSFVVPVACLWFSRNVLDTESIFADNIAGNVVGSVLASVFRFWAFRRFVFHRPSKPRTAETHVSPAVEVWLGAVDPELVTGMAEPEHSLEG